MFDIENDIYINNRAGIASVGHIMMGTWGMFSKIKVEAPVVLGQTEIDTGFIGAFSQINMGKVQAPAIHSKVECESIGRYCSIADGVNIGAGGHSTSFLSSSTFFKFNGNAKEYFLPYIDSRDEEWEKEMAAKNLATWRNPLPVIGNDVWIGMNATILNGVTVGNGAVIAAGSIVVKDVEPYTIVGGNPAKPIRKRFPDEICDRLNATRWWDYNPNLLFGLDLSAPAKCIAEIEKRLDGAEKYDPPYVEFDIDKNEWNIHEE